MAERGGTRGVEMDASATSTGSRLTQFSSLAGTYPLHDKRRGVENLSADRSIGINYETVRF